MGQVPAWGFLLFRTVPVMLSICNKRAKQGRQKERDELYGDAQVVTKRTVGISLHQVYDFAYSRGTNPSTCPSSSPCMHTLPYQECSNHAKCGSEPCR